MYLLDTNILLEILLQQENSNECEKFMNNNLGALAISDFTLHSIGVILLRDKKYEVFGNFISEVLEKVIIFNLPMSSYSLIAEYSKKTGLDFDDTYQCLVAKHYILSIVTMDFDFKKVEDVKVLFL